MPHPPVKHRSLFNLLLVGGLVLSIVGQTLQTWGETSPLPPAEEPGEVILLKGQERYDTIQIGITELIRMVETKNLDVAITKTQAQQAKGYLNQAISALFPSVRSYNYVEKLKGGEIFIGATPFDVDRVTYQPRISVEYPIQLGGKVIYQILTSQHQLNRIQWTGKRTFQKALLDALTQYFTLQRDIQGVEMARQSLKEADAQVQFTQARLRSGFGTKLDVAQSEVLQAERKNDLLKAENQREISAITLGSTLNLPFTLRVEPETTTTQAVHFLDDGLSLTQLQKMALENRPDLKELALQIKEAQARYGASRAELFPTLTLSSYRRGVGPGLDELKETTQTFAAISIDLLRNLGWGIMGDMQVQRARIQEAILNREKQLNEVEKSLSQAYQDYTLYRSQIEVTRQKMNAAMEAYRIAGAKLKTGMGLNLDVIQAQKDLSDARLEHETAMMNHNTAQARLLYETGLLTPFHVTAGLKGLNTPAAAAASP